MNVSELKAGATLDSLVALAQEWKFMQVEGNERMVIISKTGKAIDYLCRGHTCLEMLNSSKTLYQPSTNGAQSFELIPLIIQIVIEQDGDTFYIYRGGVDSLFGQPLSSSEALEVALCKAVIAAKWGDTIPDDVMEQVRP
jgi:hypothetical protein